MTINKVRGTRDLIPIENYLSLYTFIRNHLKFNHYIEIHTPYIQYEELFTKNLGIATDIVNKEMYYISHIHQEETDPKIVLRPEITASIMRAYLEENIEASPWKVFEIGPAFRHERPQKGRYREFFQCSIECIDAQSIGYDIELLFVLQSLFNSLIPNLFQLEINYIGSTTERNLYKEKLYDYCIANKDKFPLSVQNKLQLESILRILDSKDQEIQKILNNAPKISQFWNDTSTKNWETITSGLSTLKIPFIHNEKLIRGLDYYNGLIFEFVSNNLGAQNTFAGGGRYDDLASNINPKINAPALGAGIGIDRLLLIMDTLNKKIVNKDIKFVAIIIETTNFQLGIDYSLAITKEFYNNGIKSKIYFDKISLKSGLKKANMEDAYLACLITDFNIIHKKISIKEMHNEKKQIELDYKDTLPYIIKKIKE
jgi:histidyl-tRNA synthetase